MFFICKAFKVRLNLLPFIITKITNYKFYLFESKYIIIILITLIVSYKNEYEYQSLVP